MLDPPHLGQVGVAGTWHLERENDQLCQDCWRLEVRKADSSYLCAPKFICRNPKHPGEW